jgi:osmoprotectant transport system ATP-binding protein
LSPAAVFDDVSLTRGDVLALDHVSVTMPGGTTTAVLGASGSGKSTLVQLAIGLLRPDSGRVTILGEPIDYANPGPLRRRIGYAIQDVALLPHMRVRQNIVLPARLNDWPPEDIRQRLHELVDLLHLPHDVLDRYPHELSGGQQQRAGICRAMMLRPELLLLDEPFSGLDAMTRQSIHEQFLALSREEPVASILVTHDPQEAVNLARYLVVMRQGRILQHGPVGEVIEHPADDYVAKLCTGLGSIGA